MKRTRPLCFSCTTLQCICLKSKMRNGRSGSVTRSWLCANPWHCLCLRISGKPETALRCRCLNEWHNEASSTCCNGFWWVTLHASANVPPPLTLTHSVMFSQLTTDAWKDGRMRHHFCAHFHERATLLAQLWSLSRNNSSSNSSSTNSSTSSSTSEEAATTSGDGGSLNQLPLELLHVLIGQLCAEFAAPNI